MKKLLILVLIYSGITTGQNPTNYTAERTDGHSASFNLKNANGLWHISGPRSYEPNNTFSIFWHDGSYKRYLSILDNGKVGIGTNSPIDKLHVNGTTRVGDGNWGALIVDGAGQNDWLFNSHNDGNTFNFRSHRDGDPSWSNNVMSFKRNNGTVGIGTSNPSHVLDVVNQPFGPESLFRVRVNDAPQDYLSIHNATGSPGQFIPTLRGNHVTDNRASLYVQGMASDSNDNGNHALVWFDARRPAGPIQNRPLFVWTSHSTKMMTMLANGNLGIGTTNPGTYKLAVNGKIHSKEVKVDLSGWSDFVFEKDYNLPTLQEVERHIAQKGHLKDIPSAKEVEENGILLGEMDSKLLQKIEELTLYTIAQEKQLKQQQTENKNLKTKNQELENRLARLEKIILKSEDGSPKSEVKKIIKKSRTIKTKG